ncbi:hypothetical protein AYJ54_34870 [Bradyrhizobium centrolobii]|uniref:Biopolymer transport protein ExbB n=1 Tax=Bradyrhizobium centrolobii TaxID=1505087 RepID=A0A176Y6K9_9BRAD|nr:tonB-system energizer ExbB [Bradyrhizobium centrolobii]OAE97709.1 hypothetical protein AYJ54_34870 [Bradyrhizobium centrolobii]
MPGAALAHEANAESGNVAQASESSATSDARPGNGFAEEKPAARADLTSTVAVAGEAAGELSIMALVKRADFVVQFVMGALVLASLACWTVFLTKTFELARGRRQLAAALRTPESARFLEDDIGIADPSRATVGTMVLHRLAVAALNEKQLSEGLADDRVIDRYLTRAGEIARAEARRIARGTGLLATIGATAPFVGLFGTVWGIMNSFIGISRAQTTNLAVVAPGIAEALLATAMGLVAAIPAVIFYNLLARATKAYVEQVGEGAGMMVRLLSRDLARPDRIYTTRAAE